MAAVLHGNSTELATQISKATDLIVLSKDSRELRSNTKQYSTLFGTTEEKDVENLIVSSEYKPTGSQESQQTVDRCFFSNYEVTSIMGSRSAPAG